VTHGNKTTLPTTSAPSNPSAVPTTTINTITITPTITIIVVIVFLADVSLLTSFSLDTIGTRVSPETL